MEIIITKTAYEEVFYTFNFRRADGKGWLGSSEIITGTPSATVTDSQGNPQPSMVGNVSLVDDTRIKVQFKGGEADQSYSVSIKTGATSAPNKFEEKRITLKVI